MKTLELNEVIAAANIHLQNATLAMQIVSQPETFSKAIVGEAEALLSASLKALNGK